MPQLDPHAALIYTMVIVSAVAGRRNGRGERSVMAASGILPDGRTIHGADYHFFTETGAEREKSIELEAIP